MFLSALVVMYRKDNMPERFKEIPDVHKIGRSKTDFTQILYN